MVSCLISVPVKQAQAALTVSLFTENSRRSFVGALADGNTEGSSLVTIKTNGVESTSAAQLIGGDVLAIGNTTYQVATTSAQLRDNEIALSNVLTASNKNEDTPVIFKAQGRIKAVLSETVAANELIGFYLKANYTNADTDYNDGIPDSDGFDFNANANITCPAGLTLAEPIVATVDAPYHVFTCVNAGETPVVLSDAVFYINNLINPIGATTTDEINLQTVLIRKENLDGVVSETKMSSVGYSNAVKMTVRVAPQLTFKIEGVTATTTMCGSATDVATTGTTVPFGVINSVTPVNAAQKMSVTTNAASGYKVTAIASDQMSLMGQGCPSDGTGNPQCIPGHGTAGTASEWSNASGRLGFTMEVLNGDTYGNADGTTKNVQVSFADATANENAATTGWSSFTSAADAQSAYTIINNLRSTNGDAVGICYRILSSSTTLPGAYQTAVTYTITASF